MEFKFGDQVTVSWGSKIGILLRPYNDDKWWVVFENGEAYRFLTSSLTLVSRPGQRLVPVGRGILDDGDEVWLRTHYCWAAGVPEPPNVQEDTYYRLVPAEPSVAETKLSEVQRELIERANQLRDKALRTARGYGKIADAIREYRYREED